MNQSADLPFLMGLPIIKNEKWFLYTGDQTFLTDKETMVLYSEKVDFSKEYEEMIIPKSIKSAEGLAQMLSPQSIKRKYKVKTTVILKEYEQRKTPLYDLCSKCNGEGECMCGNVCNTCDGSGDSSNVSGHFCHQRVSFPEGDFSLGKLYGVALLADELLLEEIFFEIKNVDDLKIFATRLGDFSIGVAGLKENKEDLPMQIEYETL